MGDQKRRMALRKAAKEQKGFAFEAPSAAEEGPPKVLKLKIDPEMGPGIDTQASWYGMIVNEVDDEPGQEGLKVGDCIVSIAGNSLQELDDCEGVFIDALADGVEVEVEP